MLKFIVQHATERTQYNLKIPESGEAKLSFEFVSNHFHKYITVVALNLHRQRPQKTHLLLEVISNNTQIFNENSLCVSFWSHIVSHVIKKAKTTRSVHSAVHSSVTRAVGSFWNGTLVVFSPTAELNWRALVLVYWIIRVFEFYSKKANSHCNIDTIHQTRSCWKALTHSLKNLWIQNSVT